MRRRQKFIFYLKVETSENDVEFICDVNSGELGLEKYFKPFKLKKQNIQDVISIFLFIN